MSIAQNVTKVDGGMEVVTMWIWMVYMVSQIQVEYIGTAGEYIGTAGEYIGTAGEDICRHW